MLDITYAHVQIEQEGLNISEEDTGGVGDDSTFLMEIMGLNETLAASPSTNTLMAMKKENESKLIYNQTSYCYWPIASCVL